MCFGIFTRLWIHKAVRQLPLSNRRTFPPPPEETRVQHFLLGASLHPSSNAPRAPPRPAPSRAGRLKGGGEEGGSESCFSEMVQQVGCGRPCCAAGLSAPAGLLLPWPALTSPSRNLPVTTAGPGLPTPTTRLPTHNQTPYSEGSWTRRQLSPSISSLAACTEPGLCTPHKASTNIRETK